MELRFVPLLCCILLFSFAPLSAQADLPPGTGTSPRLESGAVLRFRSLPDGQTDGGASTTLLRGERGDEEGRSMALSFEEPDAEPATDDSQAVDYLVIDTGERIRRNWLEPGVIWGVHHLALRDSVDRGAFESFIHRYWAPTRADALPDSKLIFLKALTGPRAGEFSYVWLIDSEETRDYYFPKSEVPSKMYTEFEKGWSWINGDEHLGKFLAAPEDAEFTDYVVIK
ncbi:hypothetical protein [Lewinella sp. IMCC34183]|uniref:hypothetical protein n=1 Tax=Lewinella sp. IMCC34183 TaxID=2248762 RepID=UPI000E24C26D|nr:hypothetical protein [Lewinella sp. IMCC34183]